MWVSKKRLRSFDARLKSLEDSRFDQEQKIADLNSNTSFDSDELYPDQRIHMKDVQLKSLVLRLIEHLGVNISHDRGRHAGPKFSVKGGPEKEERAE